MLQRHNAKATLLTQIAQKQSHLVSSRAKRSPACSQPRESSALWPATLLGLKIHSPHFTLLSRLKTNWLETNNLHYCLEAQPLDFSAAVSQHLFQQSGRSKSVAYGSSFFFSLPLSPFGPLAGSEPNPAAPALNLLQLCEVQKMPVKLWLCATRLFYLIVVLEM